MSGLSKTLQQHGFTNDQVQTLNALMASCLNGVESELRKPVPVARARFLHEARDTAKKFLHDTGGAMPQLPSHSGLILPPGYK